MAMNSGFCIMPCMACMYCAGSMAGAAWQNRAGAASENACARGKAGDTRGEIGSSTVLCDTLPLQPHLSLAWRLAAAPPIWPCIVSAIRRKFGS